jgi:hypothetical protein
MRFFRTRTAAQELEYKSNELVSNF